MARKRKTSDEKKSAPKKAKAEPKKTEEELDMEALSSEISDLRNHCPEGSTWEKLLPLLFRDLKEKRTPTQTMLVDLLRKAIAEGRTNLVNHEKQTQHDIDNFDSIKGLKYVKMQKAEAEIETNKATTTSLEAQKDEANNVQKDAKNARDEEDESMTEKQDKYDQLEIKMTEIRDIYDQHVTALMIKFDETPTKKERSEAEKAYKTLLRDHDHWKQETTMLLHTLPHIICKRYDDRTEFEKDVLSAIVKKFEQVQNEMEGMLKNDKPDYSASEALAATYREKKSAFDSRLEELKGAKNMGVVLNATYAKLQEEFEELPLEFEKKGDEIAAIQSRILNYAVCMENVFEKLAERTEIVPEPEVVEEEPVVEESVAVAEVVDDDVEIVTIPDDDEEEEVEEMEVEEDGAVAAAPFETEVVDVDDDEAMDVDAPIEKAPELEMQYETSQPVNHDTVEAAIAR